MAPSQLTMGGLALCVARGHALRCLPQPDVNMNDDNNNNYNDNIYSNRIAGRHYISLTCDSQASNKAKNSPNTIHKISNFLALHKERI